MGSQNYETDINKIKLETVLMNKQGWYECAKLKDENTWLTLISKENMQATHDLQNFIAKTIEQWTKAGKKTSYISIPRNLLESL